MVWGARDWFIHSGLVIGHMRASPSRRANTIHECGCRSGAGRRVGQTRLKAAINETRGTSDHAESAFNSIVVVLPPERPDRSGDPKDENLVMNSSPRYRSALLVDAVRNKGEGV